MLSDREKQWVWAGGIIALILLYLWLVLFPLVGLVRKMHRRIDRSWRVLEKLDREIDRYARQALPVQEIVRRATQARQKVTAEVQVRLLTRHELGRGNGELSFSFATIWEGDRVTLGRCDLKAKASPAQVVRLIQRIDRNYTPMRVGTWRLKNLRGGVGDLTMQIYFIEAKGK